jgi:hypothetical protein
MRVAYGSGKAPRARHGTSMKRETPFLNDNDQVEDSTSCRR